MRRPAPKHPKRVSAFLMTAALLASACSGGDETDETAAATATPAEAAEPTAAPEPTAGATVAPAPAPSATPTTAPPPPATPSPTESGSSPLATWSWTQRTGAEAGFDRNRTITLESVAFGADVFVAAGSVQGPGGDFVSAEIWISQDGLEWSRVSLPDDAAGLEVRDVIFAAERFTAIGRDSSGGALWLSADGSDWEHVAPDPWDVSFVPEAVAAGPTGLVVTGVSGRQRVEMWQSPDGLEWNEATAFEDPQGIGIEDIAHGKDGYVAVGRQGEAEDKRPTIFVSADGLAWNQIAADDSLFPASASLVAVTAFQESGYVATGFDASSPNGTSLWGSPSGTEWIRSAINQHPAGVSVRHLAGARSGSTTVAVGSSGPEAKVWLVADGSDGALTLGSLPEFDLVEVSTFAEATAVAFGDDRLVVVGITIEGDRQQSTSWVATPTQ